MRKSLLVALSCTCLLGATLSSRAAGEPAARGRLERPAGVPPRSVGSPSDGALVGGVPLTEGTAVRLRWPDGPRWALPHLVTLLERAAKKVLTRFPGSTLLVGDLSRKDGGALVGHVSHESGRDADVGFYYADESGNAVLPERLLAVRPSGAVAGEVGLHFDEARNFALIEAVLTDHIVRVQRIFVADALKQRLLEFGRRHGAGEALLARVAALLQQPATGHVHDDHFHVRIACPRGEPDVCIPNPVAIGRSPRDRTAALDPANARDPAASR